LSNIQTESPHDAGPKSKIQFNGVGGLRTYVSFTHSAFS
jgi:hypothetical protein